MYRSYKRKLILTKNQEKKIISWIGLCRMVYNMGLEISIDSYNKTGRRITRFELCKQLPELRKSFDWIKKAPAEILEESIERLNNSYQNFFNKKKCFPPKFQSKKTYHSISLRRDISLKPNRVKLAKIGWLKLYKDTPIEGKICKVILKKEPDGIYAHILCNEVPPKFTSENQAIGLDMGITKFCTDSNEGMIDNPKHFKKYEKQLRIENRSLSRKKKGSNSWKKQCKRVSLLHHKIGNVRKDFLHKESTKIAKANSTVYMEDLNINNMIKFGNLSKAILDCGWGTFKEMLQYKTNVVLIDPKYTSQTCHECKSIDKKNRISQAEFVCTSCGHVSNADINAAKNIKSKGIALDRQREALACA